MSEQDDREFDALKRDYARLPKPEPGTHVDAAIRAAARESTSRRRLRVWSGALAAAACIGLAVVLVPALLIEAPAPTLEQRQADLVIHVAREEQRVAEETAAQKARERTAMPMIAAPAPPASRAAETVAPWAADLVPGLDALRAELADADEATWRRRILDLRATGQEPLATALLEDFRARFDRPASFSLDDLAREEADHRP